MLANLIPGVREIRAPLSAGYLWLLLAWLALEDKLVRAAGRGAYEPLTRLGPVAKGFGVTAIVSFVAYLVGSLAMSAIPRIPQPARLRRTVGVDPPPDGMSSDGWTGLQLWTADEIRKILAKFGKDGEVLTDFLRDGVLDSRARAKEVLTSDVGLIKTQLLAGADRLYGEVDRKESEASFRFAIIPPLLGLLGYLVVADSPAWSVAILLVLGLLVQGWRLEQEAGDTFVTAIRAVPDIEAPTLVQLEYRLRNALPDVTCEYVNRRPLAAEEYPDAFRFLARRLREYDAKLFDRPPKPLRALGNARIDELRSGRLKELSPQQRERLRQLLRLEGEEELDDALERHLLTMMRDLSYDAPRRAWNDLSRILAVRLDGLAEGLERAVEPPPTTVNIQTLLGAEQFRRAREAKASRD